MSRSVGKAVLSLPPALSVISADFTEKSHFGLLYIYFQKGAPFCFRAPGAALPRPLIRRDSGGLC